MTRPVTEAGRGKAVLLPQWKGSQDDWHWQDKAACAKVDEVTQYLFTNLPAANRGTRARATAQAQRLNETYCSQCPVIKQCQRWADSDLFFTGIAAGRPYLDRNGRS